MRGRLKGLARSRARVRRYPIPMSSSRRDSRGFAAAGASSSHDEGRRPRSPQGRMTARRRQRISAPGRRGASARVTAAGRAAGDRRRAPKARHEDIEKKTSAFGGAQDSVAE